MTAISDKQDEIAAVKAAVQTGVDALSKLYAELVVLQDANLDAKDDEIDGLVVAIENANGNAKHVLRAELYARVLAGVAEAGYDEDKQIRARGRAARALLAEDGPAGTPLGNLPPGLGRGNGKGR